MKVASIIPSVPLRLPSQLRSSASSGVGERSVEGDGGTHEARLRALVELITTLTGRTVELVPPAPYFVSAPARPREVKLEVVSDHESPPRLPDGDGPVRIDITDVLSHGSTERMRLAGDGVGGLSLHPELDVGL